MLQLLEVQGHLQLPRPLCKADAPSLKHCRICSSQPPSHPSALQGSWLAAAAYRSQKTSKRMAAPGRSRTSSSPVPVRHCITWLLSLQSAPGYHDIIATGQGGALLQSSCTQPAPLTIQQVSLEMRGSMMLLSPKQSQRGQHIRRLSVANTRTRVAGRPACSWLLQTSPAKGNCPSQ